MVKQIFIITLSYLSLYLNAWPDGMPCSKGQLKSMNPLEAPEHQGGLMLTEPPYEIEVSSRCYWRNTPISVTLKGKDRKTRFKGFAMQSRYFNGPMRGQRAGSFLRLDANGSWQVQCFKHNNSITHSHNEKKSQLTFWWKSNGDEAHAIQFVATVVESVKVFWVESVLSNPIPPCKIEREFGPWEPSPITPPPIPSQFKIETAEIFRTGLMTSNRIPFQRNMKDSRKEDFVSFQTKSTLPRQQPLRTTAAPRQIHEGSVTTNFLINSTPSKGIKISHVTLKQRQNLSQKRGRICIDKADKNRCLAWARFCQQSIAIRQACSRTCRVC